MKQKSFLSIITTMTVLLPALAFDGCNKEDAGEVSAASAVESADYDAALSAADAIISASGGDKITCRTRGLALLGKGDYAAAADAFIDALSFSNGIVTPADIDISYYLAVAEYKNDDLEAAHSTIEAILALKEDDDAAWFMLGKTDLAMGNRESALTDFDNTVSLAPTNYDRYVGIYEELHARGYDEDAASYLEKAMSAGNRLSDYNKGVLEYYLGSYTGARNDLENAKKSGNNENLTLYLGRTYEALGDTGYAMSLYADYIRENPAAGRIYEQLATCRVSTGDYEGALETIETGLAAGQGEGAQGMMFDRVVAYERLYDFKSAAKYMEEYLEQYPDDEMARRENVFLSSR
ncbi:MAG: tetratricopeptide repeat protein [Lachnospiraceae bacterium]|nr:tetratricopeptide repeat protein [Lachnospiraceae bacterium]